MAESPDRMRFVIVGAGEAGTRAALALRQAGAGEVILAGAEPDAPYERPPLSKPQGDGVALRPIASDLAGIEVMLGIEVEKMDRHAKELILSGGCRLAYDRLLLATGAHPARSPAIRMGWLRFCEHELMPKRFSPAPALAHTPSSLERG